MGNLLQIIETDIFPLKYYGVSDLTTNWDINNIIKNKDQFEIYYKNYEGNIRDIDEYIDYLILIKLCNLKEIIPYIKIEKNKNIVSNVCSIAEINCKKVRIGTLIDFISDNFERLLRKNKDYLGLSDVTWELIEKYQTGIKTDTFLKIVNKYPYIILYKYNLFQKSIETNEEIFEELFKIENIEKYIDKTLNTVLNIISSMAIRRKDLFLKLSSVIDYIIEYGDSILLKINEDTVIYHEKKIKSIYKFLKKIKHVQANRYFAEVEKLDKVVHQYIQKNGQTSQYEIPMEAIKGMLESNYDWWIKMLLLTHNLIDEKYTSQFNSPPISKNSMVDFVTVNIETDDYFTFSHQKKIDITLCLGAAIIMRLINEGNYFEDSISASAGIIEFIGRKIEDDELVKDFELLSQMVYNIFKCTPAEETEVVHSLGYGLSMFTCAFIEKILRKTYVHIKQDEEYIPLDSITLGQLLSDGNTLFKDIFGEYRLKHLRYIFITHKNDNNEIGLNYRNRLAHWKDIRPDDISVTLMCKLLYVLIYVVNSIFLYFAKD